jgi:diguanylate cyclase (GGDEF)-like protein
MYEGNRMDFKKQFNRKKISDNYLETLKIELMKILLFAQLGFSAFILIYSILNDFSIFAIGGHIGVVIIIGILIYLLSTNINTNNLATFLTLFYTIIIVPVLTLLLGFNHILTVTVSIYTIILIILLLERDRRMIVFFINIAVAILLTLVNLYLNNELLINDQILNSTIISFLPIALISASVWIFKSKFYQINDALYESTLIDSLTGAYNVRMLKNELLLLNKEYEENQINYTVAMVDFDNFKLINDEYGHDNGDKLLCEFVDFSKKYIRNDDKIIRYGGDEFILLFKDCDVINANKIVKRIQDDMGNLKREYNNVEISFSVGICDNKEAQSQNIDIIKLADRLMYIGKNNSKNIIPNFE